MKPTGRRYSPVTISHAVIVHGKSPSAYRFLRDSGILTLPHVNTLQSYLGPSTGETGVTDLIDRRMRMEVVGLTGLGTFSTIQIDEMHTKTGTKYDRTHDQVIGLAENNDDESECVLANKMLCFYLTGLSTGFKIPVAFYFVKALNADQLYRLSLSVLACVEEVGFRVIRIATDNAKTNASFFKKLAGGEEGKFAIPHPLDPTRTLFLSYDYTHLLKNSRNLWIDRDFLINDSPVRFSPVKLIYEMNKDKAVKPVRYLTRRHVSPTSFERQKVKLALDVFSPPVVAAIKMYASFNTPGFENVKETITFIENVFKFWTVHDVSNTTHHVTARMEDKAPFSSMTDERLAWLEEEFPDYLKKWQDETSNRNEYLSKETSDALIFTCRSTAACIRYLLQAGFLFVLTRKFSTDSIERFFGSVRARVQRSGA